MTEQGKRAAIYLRVSSEEQVQGYSLDAQERAVEALCRQHGWDLVARYRDEGKSARSDSVAKRPAFKQMLSDADAGRFDVLVVHKMDRFARNMRVALDAFARLAHAGVRFVSASENTDWDTPAGRLQRNMLLSVAEWFSDNLAWETRKGKGERKAQGRHNGLLPFGVTTNAAGVPVLDAQARSCLVASRAEIVPGEGLVLAFELAAAGKSDREVAQALTRAGFRTSGNRGANPFTKDTVRVILRNRFYVGDLPDGHGGWVPGKHGALVDPALFDRAQRAREANAKRPRWTASARSPWALSGLATCGGCGRNVTAEGKGRARCAGRTQGNGCDQPSFAAARVEAQVEGLLAAFAIPGAQRDRLLSAWRRSQSAAVDTAAARIGIRRKLDRLRELYLDGDLDKGAYQTRKAALHDELAALPPEGDPDGDAGERLAGFLADVGSAWRVATPAERNTLARTLFAGVVVANRTAVAVVPRPELRPFFAVNPLVESCTGGSDGDRFSTFKTRSSIPSGFKCPTSEPQLPPPRGGPLGRSVTTPRSAAIATARAS